MYYHQYLLILYFYQNAQINKTQIIEKLVCLSKILQLEHLMREGINLLETTLS